MPGLISFDQTAAWSHPDMDQAQRSLTRQNVPEVDGSRNRKAERLRRADDNRHAPGPSDALSYMPSSSANIAHAGYVPGLKNGRSSGARARLSFTSGASSG